MNRYNHICQFLFLFRSLRGRRHVWCFCLLKRISFIDCLAQYWHQNAEAEEKGSSRILSVYKRMSHYSRSASLASLTLFIDSRVVRVQIVKTKGKCLSPLFPFQSENFPFYAIVSKKRSGKECHLSFFYFHWLNKNLEESPTECFLKPRIASQHIILNRMNTVSEFQWSAVT